MSRDRLVRPGVDPYADLLNSLPELLPPAGPFSDYAADVIEEMVRVEQWIRAEPTYKAIWVDDPTEEEDEETGKHGHWERRIIRASFPPLTQADEDQVRAFWRERFRAPDRDANYSHEQLGRLGQVRPGSIAPPLVHVQRDSNVTWCNVAVERDGDRALNCEGTDTMPANCGDCFRQLDAVAELERSR